MMKKINYTVWVCALLTGCSSFIDVSSPNTTIPPKVVFKDYETAQAALAHVYTKLFYEVVVTGSASGIGVLMGAYTDELTYYNSMTPSVSFYQNQVTPIDFTLGSLWNKSYNLIYVINNIINGVENSDTLNKMERQMMLGEAHFLRAYLHYFLLGLFGEVPYIIKTDHIANTKVSKVDSDSYLKLLTNDLNISFDYLKEAATTKLRTKPSHLAVLALLARVNLLKRDWQSVVDACNSIINTPYLSLEQNIDLVFLKESKETIWQLSNSTNGGNTLEAATHIFVKSPPPVFSLSERLYRSFEPDDERKAKWIDSLVGNNAIYAHSYKYKQNKATDNSLEYSVQIRLGEIYLLRAEAYIRSNRVESGINDINLLRERANLFGRVTTDSLEAMNFLEAEKRHELFCEQGHRFFDLKRWNRLNQALSYKDSWFEHFKNLPLPESELLLNPNLKPQNNGY